MSAFSKSLKALEAAEAALRIWEEERTVSAFDEASGSAERLQTDADGFSRRLEEVDALTQEPRYGPKMRERVKDFLTRQQRLTEALESTAAAAAASRAQLQVQAEDVAREKEEVERAREEEHRMRVAAKGAELAERIGATALAQAEDDPGRAELREAAEAARLQRKAAEEAAEQERIRLHQEREAACRAWQAGAGTGSEAFQAHLASLLALLDEIPADRDACLRGLHVIISNRSRKPEADDYKLLRCGNKNFARDIGKFEPAKLCLAALGYHLKVLPARCHAPSRVGCHLSEVVA
mmetsp:Transcript_4412/g.17349  ORF Transcript_4412/g.17349 Transcript_4412/m.17349 type:complete len:295 (-) Transcript_4412:250-1134(-)